MKPIYRAPAYQFLAFLQKHNEIHADVNRILDCGAGGKTPPLGLFYEHGFQTAGIDISEDQLTLAHRFEQEHGMQLNIQKGDMQAIPFPDASFDFVFEMYAMLHLPKAGIRKTLSEIKRVLKPQGIAFVTFMSTDTFPMDGKEKAPGEFHCIEDGQKIVHSIFSDAEAFQYCSDWQILFVIKQGLLEADEISSMTQSDWLEFYKNNDLNIDQINWMNLHPQRLERWRSVHSFFILRKIKS